MHPDDRAWLDSAHLVAALADARRRSVELLENLTDEQMRAPLLAIINPPLWEFGHAAWFQEKWTLRHLRGEPPIVAEADALWDSAAVAHDTRWNLPLLSREATLRYAREVFDRAVERLPQSEVPERVAYFYWLAVMHEDMHAEACLYTRQTLGLPPPKLTGCAPPAEDGAASSDQLRGDVQIPGGEYLLGAAPGESFVFDNEKWAHPVRVAPFAIARAPVTNGQFAEFVDDGGYRRQEWWSAEGRGWLERERAGHPVYWVRDAAGWHQRHFDQVRPLPRGLPIIHVNWYEAEAYCHWAGRRLPSEAEWEMAAAAEPSVRGIGDSKRKYAWGDSPPSPGRAQLDARTLGPAPVTANSAGDSAFGCRQMIGNVWEWTATEFGPYPGFVVDPYKEYSQPWFGPPYKVLRGGCWATRSRLIRNTWRNFYTADRRDVFCGFRTCAV
jgi:iron(II)-dependent oxidoreductase